MGIGAVFVNQLVKWDVQLQEDLDKMLEKAKAANERRYIGQYLAFLLYLFRINRFIRILFSVFVWCN